MCFRSAERRCSRRHVHGEHPGREHYGGYDARITYGSHKPSSRASADLSGASVLGRPRIRAGSGLRGTCAGWAKVGLKPDITASRERESACHTYPEARIDRRYQRNTPLQRHGSYGVHWCAAHFTEPSFLCSAWIESAGVHRARRLTRSSIAILKARELVFPTRHQA